MGSEKNKQMSGANQSSKPIQKILFGSPGTGKSYKVRKIAKEDLGISLNPNNKSLENTVQVVFHPEYTYSDFMGKLLPQTTEHNQVIYKFYPGHFLQALGLSYKQILDGTNQNVLLVIDELNRGNAAAIFGTVFQLLDRNNDNWSTYDVNLSELEMIGLLKSMGCQTRISGDNIDIKYNDNDSWNNIDIFCNNFTDKSDQPDAIRVLENLKHHKISIPSNLSIIATINTSDESIYYLDSAFKRRWYWEYIDINIDEIPEKLSDVKIKWKTETGDTKLVSWLKFLTELNDVIKRNHKLIRRIEDQQIGFWFLKSDHGFINRDEIENKLMFYLWDSVFSRDKRPLEDILSPTTDQEFQLITYYDFLIYADQFVFSVLPENEWEQVE